MLTQQNLQRKTVPELRRELESRGLPQTGLKNELIERLENAAAAAEGGPPSAESADSSSILFPLRVAGLVAMLAIYVKVMVLLFPSAVKDVGQLTDWVRTGRHPWQPREARSSRGPDEEPPGSDSGLPRAEELVYTAAELAEHDGAQEAVQGGWLGASKPDIWLSIGGVVFDVSGANGRDFYDVGAPYHCFAGKVVTRALVLGSLELADIEAEDEIGDFSESSVEELRERVRFYEDKYRRIGVLDRREQFLELGIR